MTEEWTFDDIGPQRVYHYYEPKSRMRAVLAIDTLQFRYSAGGIRMLPDISVAEIVLLARAMTYKYAWLDLNCAGSKAGIWFDPQTQDREAVLRAFGEAVAPLLQTRAYMGGADMGTSDEDVEIIYAAAGVKSESGGLSSRRLHGLRPEELVTGFGVIKSAARASEILGWSLGDASVAIEGLGKVGAGCLRQASRKFLG